MGPGPYLTYYYHHTGALPIFHPVFCVDRGINAIGAYLFFATSIYYAATPLIRSIFSLSLQSHTLQDVQTCICNSKRSNYAHVMPQASIHLYYAVVADVFLQFITFISAVACVFYYGN